MDVEEPIKFGLISTGTSFYVKVPQSKRTLVKNLYGARYNNSKRAYIFLLEHLPEVEKALGFESGASGLKNPAVYIDFVLTGKFHHADGIKSLMNEIGDLDGCSYSKDKRQFKLDVKHYDKIKKFIEEDN